MHENYFLLHGSFGSTFSNWIPYVRKEVENKNLEVYTPDFPTGVGFQNYETWEKLLCVYLEAGLIHNNTVFIAHSIAPVFVCKFLSNQQIKVKRLVFVCGFNNYLGIDDAYDKVNESMYTDNDPYVPLEVEEDFAKKIATKSILIPNGGHLNSEFGYEEALFLLPYL